ncbi:MAG: peptidylprolyl isomerase [Gaiellaceae bacterium]
MPARVVALVLLLLTCAACGGGDDDNGDDGGEAQVTATQSGCRDVQKPEAKPDGGQKAPEGPLDTSEKPRLTISTNCGDFTIQLDPKLAPDTTASFVKLAKSGFFDNTIFHRIVPEFVIQGGDPTGSGMGGPGYSTVDRPPADARYTKGVVAMAKTAQEAPGTSGSQFFVVTGADVGLPPDYAIIGKVSDGLDVVERIGELGDETQQPTQTIVIEKVTVNP